MPFGESLSFNMTTVRNLIGLLVDTLPPSSYFASRSLVAEGLTMSSTSEQQKVHIVLWLALCGLLRNDRGSRVSTKFLMPLEHLSEASIFDWVELGYCSLLPCLHIDCRQLSDGNPVSLFGPWRLLEVRSDIPPDFYLIY